MAKRPCGGERWEEARSPDRAAVGPQKRRARGRAPYLMLLVVGRGEPPRRIPARRGLATRPRIKIGGLVSDGEERAVPRRGAVGALHSPTGRDCSHPAEGGPRGSEGTEGATEAGGATQKSPHLREGPRASWRLVIRTPGVLFGCKNPKDRCMNVSCIHTYTRLLIQTRILPMDSVSPESDPGKVQTP